MKINKILNNNYVTSYNDDTGEIVVMGPGVGFRKKAGNTIDSNKIEKIFYLPICNEYQSVYSLQIGTKYCKDGIGKVEYSVL